MTLFTNAKVEIFSISIDGWDLNQIDSKQTIEYRWSIILLIGDFSIPILCQLCQWEWSRYSWIVLEIDKTRAKYRFSINSHLVEYFTFDQERRKGKYAYT